ncbi:MAG: O-antigen ligase family protein, partial [Planctomycetota bacterium]
VGALILGLQAYQTPYRAFESGRLETVGGSDFSDANRFAGYVAGVLFLIGAQFFRSDWRDKILCLVAGVFATNAIILTRSRGAVLGVAFGVLVAGLLAPRKHRWTIFGGFFIAACGALYLSDARFLSRASTIAASAEARDTAAQMRLEIWTGGYEMLKQNPLGVGPGNFYQNIGTYAPAYSGRGAHNTFVRCAGELGWPGLILFTAIVVNAFRILRRVTKGARQLLHKEGTRLMWASYGAMTGLVAVLGYGLTGTLLYTEYLWWFLALPVCLERTLVNLKQEVTAADVAPVAVEVPRLQPATSIP